MQSYFSSITKNKKMLKYVLTIDCSDLNKLFINSDTKIIFTNPKENKFFLSCDFESSTKIKKYKNHKCSQSFSICSLIGSPNKRTKRLLENHKKEKYRFPNKKTKKVYDATSLLIRMAMRYPNEEIQNNMHKLFLIIKNNLIDNQSDDVLEGIYNGSKENSRGGFDDANDMKDFFNKNPKNVHPSILLCKLESFLSGTGYFYGNVINGYISTITPQQQKFIELLKNEVKFVGRIEELHSKRLEHLQFCPKKAREKFGKKKCKIEAGFTSDLSDYESDSEGVIIKIKKPQIVMKARIHTTEKGTYPGDALASNIMSMTGPSGTTPLVGSIIEWLTTKDVELNKWFKQDDNATQLLVYLLGCTFHRADFHTLNEVYAGVEFYLQKRNNTPQLSSTDCAKALNEALLILQKSITNERIHIVDSENKNNIIAIIEPEQLHKDIINLVNHIAHLCHREDLVIKTKNNTLVK